MALSRGLIFPCFISLSFMAFHSLGWPDVQSVLAVEREHPMIAGELTLGMGTRAASLAMAAPGHPCARSIPFILNIKSIGAKMTSVVRASHMAVSFILLGQQMNPGGLMRIAPRLSLISRRFDARVQTRRGL
jgi:hypothetical protein